MLIKSTEIISISFLKSSHNFKLVYFQAKLVVKKSVKYYHIVFHVFRFICSGHNHKLLNNLKNQLVFFILLLHITEMNVIELL